MLQFRDLLQAAESQGRLRHDVDPRLPRLEASSIIARHDPHPVLLQDVLGWTVAANLLTHREAYAETLDLDPRRFLADLRERLEGEPAWSRTDQPVCQALVDREPDLTLLPLLTHFDGDGGPYLTSGVWIVTDPRGGRNLSYHRMMPLGPRRGAVRVVEGRGMAQALAAADGQAEVAIVIGAPPQVLLAASLSPAPDVDELELAARLAPVSICRAVTVDLEIPADAELVIEGRFTGELADEGPFVDITGTLDGVRPQPVLEVTAITHRQDPVYHALLPAGAEHRGLMGLPKELDIAREVARICPVSDVVMTPGSGSWLHAVLAIQPRRAGDARAALEAAFRAHPSLKRCVAVDGDIDPADPGQVDWALATRFQAHRDLLVLEDRPSSSLDPSAQHVPGAKSRGSKMGLDATIPVDAPDPGIYRRAEG